MKGILFGGCSFTWGQGLYFYSDLNRIQEPPEWQFRPELVTHSHIRFKDTIRFPRLVANHFKTFECFKKPNGGSEDETFNFFEKIFDKNNQFPNNSFLTTELLEYDDIDFIVLQTSQLWRNKFYFTLDGVEQYSNVWAQDKGISFSGENSENFEKWLIKNNMDYNQWMDLFSKQQVERIKKEFEFYESKGIKCIIFCWEENHLRYIKSDNFLNERFFDLEYKNKKYDCIRQMMDQNRELEISMDYEYFKSTPPKDHHPSKKCHEVLANNIIKKIESRI
jgi:hypothetical protein